MKKSLLASGWGALLVAATTAATSAYATDNCQRVRGELTEEDVQFPCLVNADFDGCFLLDMDGTFRTVHAFVQNDDFILNQDIGLPEPEGSNSNYWRELHVYENSRGTATGDVQYIFDLRIFDVNGGFVAPAIITQGTGIYEGATGWIASVFTDASLQKAIVRGRLCGPNIPRDDDDDSDSDSDSD